MYYKVKKKMTQAKSRKIHCKTFITFVPYTDQDITKYFRPLS